MVKPKRRKKKPEARQKPGGDKYPGGEIEHLEPVKDQNINTWGGDIKHLAKHRI
ncbi:hypothetical protein HYD72_03755 [Mycoplasmopsis bovis]|nr:hypothetical protein [Mycoplasmopsis bovis]QQH49383.1 hypothetical protein HYD72_03755 [Mycoplasmopsis bovis]